MVPGSAAKRQGGRVRGLFSFMMDLRWEACSTRFPQLVQKSLFFGRQGVRAGGFDLDPDALELPCFIRRQRSHPATRTGLLIRPASDRWHGGRGSRSARRLRAPPRWGAVANRQPATTTLRDQTPKIETDESEHAGQRRYRHNAEEQDAVTRKVEGVGKQQTADRSRGAKGEDVVPPHQERRHCTVADRCHHRRGQIEKDEHPGPPKVLEDRPKTPQDKHVDSHVPELVMGEGGGYQRPYQPVFDVGGADQEIGAMKERRPGSKDVACQARKTRTLRAMIIDTAGARGRLRRAGGVDRFNVSGLVGIIHRRRIMAEPDSLS